MSAKTRQAIKALEAALLLGVLGDGLLRATPWGLNVLVWVGALSLALMVLLGGRRKCALSGGGHWLLLSAILFAASIAWRDSRTLNCLAGSGVLISLALIAWRARGGRLWLAGIAEYFLGIVLAGVNTFLAGFPLLFFEVRWREIPVAGWSRQVKAVMGGLLIALPLLILFTALFASADASFERMINRFFFTNYDEIFGHIFLTLILAWLAGGFLRGLLFGWKAKLNDGHMTLVPPDQVENCGPEPAKENVEPQALKPKQVSLGIIQIGMTLGLLNLLFLCFVLLQLPYFFGSSALVQASNGMTFSEYYRRGFFELVTVAGLVLPLLLIAHWLLRKGNPTHERIFRLLAGTQIFLLFIIMASAVRRMLLYQSEYGLTELRFYTTAFMAWLALVFVWFAATALRGRREQFAFGALIACLLVIITLHVINPDAFIVRVNVAHAQSGRSFDADYAASLSADAMPALIESLPSLNESARRVVASRVLNNWARHGRADWRSWNWSRSRYRRTVLENMNLLRAIVTPQNE
ncbi:MAG TPA: DUF4173 domain-containing protein [Pyrinomonadaceae bacterium]